jgi:type IV pilus assembly protein PilC
MPTFAYEARDNRGQRAAGVLVAGTLSEAGKALHAEGKIILELQEQSPQQASAAARPAARSLRVPHDEVIIFANQLAVMLDTGVPLVEALQGMTDQAVHPNFRLVLSDINEHVNSGQDFSSALARHPRVFGQLFASMVRASEASGTLSRMLQRVAKYLQEQRAIVRRVKGAMAYPSAMLGFCVLVVVGMLVFILPRFEKIYEGKKAVLPLPTRLLLGMSNGLLHYWPVVLGVLAAAVGLIVFTLRTSEGRVALDRLKVRLPVLGGMYRKACLARGLRTLGTLISTGVSLLDAMEITAEVSGNVVFADAWRRLARRVKEGSPLSDEMMQMPIFPHHVSQMLSAGEKAGRLASVLERVSGFCEEDLQNAVRTATSFIEPIMIVIMGMIVGGITLALLLPIFSLSKVMAS